MAASTSTLFRAGVLIGGGVLAVVALVQPRRQEAAHRHRAANATSLSASQPLPPADRVTREGLVITDSRDLLARLQRSRSKGTVVNVWASWCGSCKADIPLLLGLGKSFAGSIDVVLVSVDEQGTLGDAAEMLRGLGAPARSYVVDEPLEQFKAAINPRWPGMLPATFLFDGTAKLRYFWGGPVVEGDIAPLLRRYLNGEHIDGEANFALAPGAVTE